MVPTSLARNGAILARRALLLHALPLATIVTPTCSFAASVDPFFDRLRARYILLRPGETTFEAASIVDSNPINKQNDGRGLTSTGRQQVYRTVEALRARGIDSPHIFYDNGVRASETADIVARELDIPRRDVDPEFRWLEARGYGALDGTDLRTAVEQMRELDKLDIDSQAEGAEDGTPNDSVNEVFSRLRNTIAKIEQTYGSGDFLIIGGDDSVLSIFAAAACGADLRDHSRFSLGPGEFWDLRELVQDCKAGRFQERAVSWPSEDAVKRARAALKDYGPRLFSDTEAGSCLCCSCAR